MRRAVASDIPELVRITNLAYVVEGFCIQGQRTSPEEVAGLLEEGMFLVEPGGSGLKGSVFLRRDGARWYLGLLSVAPDCQGRGLGRRLVGAAEEACRAEGGKFLDLTVVSLRKELFAFSEGLGFHANDVLPFREPGKLILPCHLVRYTKALVPATEL
ncbi:MAG: GNAT family N-acetyltransferase [Holophaga sp.]|nr:GNAT family N-acetyltransferase [Holophaga sp.]